MKDYNPKVHLFGSTISGLGFKGCDIDAYVDIWPVENNCKEPDDSILLVRAHTSTNLQ